MAIDPLPPPVPTLTPTVGAPRPLREVNASVVRADASDEQGGVAAVPSSEPPPAALDAVQAASRAYEVLRRSGRELRFETRDDGIVQIDVYDGTGRLVRSIPPDQALSFLTQEASWQA